ncbi:MAG: efflux RND transporter periplasmic adaptor subunit [Pseudomonadota bacterium]|nr:efflux RND transporter periplasmic adaptor subunit [Pseudomonadota bacterium]
MYRPLPRLLPYVLVPLGIAALVAAVRLRPVDTRAHRVDRGDVVAEVLGVGVLESTREVRVSFEASGRVTSLAVDEGTVVAEGDVLGTIDASDATRELAVAGAAEEAAVAVVARARAELERARVASMRAAADRGRADTLFAAGVIHAAEHEAAIERDDSAGADVRAMESGLVQAERSQDVAARTRGIRSAQVADGRLASPLSGLVVARDVEAGQLVTPGSPAFTIVSTEAMRVRAWVDETALGTLAVGQPARLVFRSEPDRPFAGTVTRIGREVDRQTHELLVDVAVLELPTNFAVGQRADAWIEVGRSASVASVPRGWCDTRCAVLEDGRVASREVTLGLAGRDRVEVSSGLAPDDVVLAPGATIGRRVRITEEQ